MSATKQSSGNARAFHARATAPHSPRSRNRFPRPDVDRYDGRIDLHAYVGNDPMNSTDPEGQYICRGSEKNCDSVAKGIQQIKAASTDTDLTKAQRQELAKVVGFYGEAGVDNGVNVSFSSRVELGEADINGKDGSIEIRLTSRFSQAFEGKAFQQRLPGMRPDVERAAVLAHEGRHGIDISRCGYICNDRYTLERNAYSVQSFVNQAFNFRSQNNLWDPAWKTNQDNLRAKAINNVTARWRIP